MTNANRWKPRITPRAAAVGVVALAGITLAASWAAIALAAPAKPAGAGVTGMTDMAGMHGTAYDFTTLDNAKDLTFNQLLGINNEGVIAGYFGSGAAGHPNKGYLLPAPYGQGGYTGENFPGSAQTQVTGLNDNGATVGFWSSMDTASQVDNNFGFYKLADGSFHTVNFPTGDNAIPPVNQLLGVNDHDVAVGFYTNGAGNNRGYSYDIGTGTFTRVLVPGYPAGSAGPSLTAAAINDNGDIAGYYTNKAGVTVSFLDYAHGPFRTLPLFPGSTATTALGVNDHDEVVGTYTDGTGSSATMHGFTWTPGGGYTSVDDPSGAGTTTINGVNNEGDLVGFYTDSAGNTDGFLATPAHQTTLTVNLMPMPQGSVIVTPAAGGQDVIQVSAFGLTPGSAHTVLLFGNPIGTLTADGTGQASASFTVGGIPATARVKILDGGPGTSVIAQTAPLTNGDSGPYQLQALEPGFPQGSPQGQATITYDPSAQTITVTLTASGVSPGPHAAHIHIGSCQSQGPVQYMLKDFVANGNGVINHETRTVTGVTSVMLTGGWYLNLHQGDMSNIVSNGQPTISFRPLLCANI